MWTRGRWSLISSILYDYRSARLAATAADAHNVTIGSPPVDSALSIPQSLALVLMPQRPNGLSTHAIDSIMAPAAAAASRSNSRLARQSCFSFVGDGPA